MGLEMPERVEFRTLEQVVGGLASRALNAGDITHGLRALILAHDSQIHSFTTVPGSYGGDTGLGPLHGLPVAVKDIIDTSGIPTEYGSRIFSGHVPREDAAVVRNLKKAGGVVQGKTSTHEFAMGIVTPQTSNPWDRERITGGSSGGSAAALAAGFSLFALGTDTAGSIRIPSAFCGITGLKPSTGMLPLKGIYPEAWSLDTVGPMCRYASDIPMLLRAMGYRHRPIKEGAAPTAAVITNLAETADSHVRRAFNRFLDTIASEGIIEVGEVAIGELGKIAELDDLMDSAENSHIQSELFREQPDRFTELSREQLRLSSEIKASEYIEAQRERKRYRALFSSLRKKHRFLLSPTMPSVAPMHRDVEGEHPGFYMKYMAYTNPYNFTGEPAISIPIGFESDLPIGAQLSSPWGDDMALSGLAASFQDVSDFHMMYPGWLAGTVRKFVESVPVP